MHLAHVRGFITQQVGDAEVHAAAAGEDFAADAALHFVGIIAGIGFGERDRHLHRPAGLHRVPVLEQALAQRHAADQVFVHLAEFTLGAHHRQPVGITAAVAGRQLERGVQGEKRDVFCLGAALEFGPRNPRQVRHHRVGDVARFLFKHGQHRADVLGVGGNLLRLHGHGDVGGPALPVRHVRRDAAGHVLPNLLQRRPARRGGAGAKQQRGQGQAGQAQGADRTQSLRPPSAGPARP